jgi:hypothetical protein
MIKNDVQRFDERHLDAAISLENTHNEIDKF